MDVQAIKHIEISKQSGVPRITGRRITVHHLVIMKYRNGHGVEELAEMYDLTLGQVYAAFSFYHDNKELVDSFIEAHDRAWETVKGLSDPPGDELWQVMTVREVAAVFNLDEKTVREAAAKEWIYGRKSGATWLIRRRDAEARWGKRRTDNP